MTDDEYSELITHALWCLTFAILLGATAGVCIGYVSARWF